MLPDDQNIQKLEEPESLDVLIVSKRLLGPRGLNWQYQLWTIDEGSSRWDKPYSFLYSPEDMELYPGQRATVTGDQIWRATPPDNQTRLILQDAPYKNFELYVDQTIRLLNPIKSDKENSIFATELRAEVNGRPVIFNMSVIMEGATIDSFFGEPEAVIKKIVEPNIKKGYLLIADFINPNSG